ncbi:MAG: hypothetical protein VB125_05480, partial [Burkholderia sp.]
NRCLGGCPSGSTRFCCTSTLKPPRYNREWRLEKLGFKSPLEARQAALLPLATCRLIAKSCLNNRIGYTREAD